MFRQGQHLRLEPLNKVSSYRLVLHTCTSISISIHIYTYIYIFHNSNNNDNNDTNHNTHTNNLDYNDVVISMISCTANSEEYYAQSAY